jgi:hypothetical protein
MNFKEAYQKMLEGKKVKRKGWEGWQHYKLIGDNMYYADKLIASNITVENALADDWEIVGETKNKVWKPKKGDKYFIISSRLEVVKFNNQEDSIDKKVINSGNCFKTKEEAQHMVDKLKVIKELQDFAIENRDEEIDWYDKEQDKWAICYDIENKEIAYESGKKIKSVPFNVYFATEKDCERAIKTIGEDRIKKYYFDIED